MSNKHIKEENYLAVLEYLKNNNYHYYMWEFSKRFSEGVVPLVYLRIEDNFEKSKTIVAHIECTNILSHNSDYIKFDKHITNVEEIKDIEANCINKMKQVAKIFNLNIFD